jgi:flavin-dependent dehydrogenase
MPATEKVYDFLIIGGGPTGTTAATYLARYGYSVMLFERTLFPRQHEGESLLPFCTPLLKDLGVIPEMDKHFVRKPGVQFASHDNEYKSSWWFRNIIPGENELSYHVIRAEFDHILLKNAIMNGASALQETRVEEVALTNEDGMVALTTSNPEHGRQNWKGKYVIDASGQDTFLGKKFGTKAAVKHLDRVAFLAHWGNANYTYGLDQGLLNMIYLEDKKKGWMAIQPVGKDRLSVALIIDRNYLKQQKKILFAQYPDNWQEMLYKQEIKAAPFAHHILEQAVIVQKLVVLSDYSYTTSQRFGKNYALLGDAFKFLDPIFASGVYLGMNSARLFAEGIHQTIQQKESGSLPLDQVFNQITGAYDLVEKFINIFYDPSSLNLSEINPQTGEIHNEHQLAFSLVHFLLAGDFFTNYQKYSEFLDLLSNPIQLKRWKALVNSKQVFGQPTYSFKEIFGSIID